MEILIILGAIVAVLTFGPALFINMPTKASRRRDHIRELEAKARFEREEELRRREREEANQIAQLSEYFPPQPVLPYPRHIEDFRDYEFRSAEVMKAFGFGSVRVTQGSRDGGLDVICNQAVAQCKMHMRPIGTPALQQFYGAASAYVARLPLYFAASGYSAGALTWGTEKRMYLFTLKTNGEIKAENQYARNLMSKGWARMELERKANG